ncbi:carbohydrate-binding module family 50 protein [Amorphotheca resinae ATCC 22711]|jgi:hypothetical protein|uniref:Carbohydrate-binding module family 50 protein n=1 Tax=Amorphotheca resinae ATCC 22711 TaxID=857342 RepID=A0A2T3BBM8_AMORE|nr:carbohydrate-binding module family 50 protein [Amorphotheca resinae ATCC 22711]PSS25664.1 carbohydrate-binding module family 50 protein [Amorphotheca resinae ATCC 22711]
MNRDAGASNPNLRRFPSNTDDHENGREATTVRPRNRRFVTAEQELVKTTATSTPSASRAVSPIPSKHPSRSAAEAGTRSNGRPVGGLEVPGANSGGRSSPSLGGILEGGWTSSWSALQGLASSVLGVDTDNDNGESSKAGGFLKKLKGGTERQKIPDTWGPAGLPKKGEDVIGAGSAKDREAAVRAMKMRGLLESREEDLNVRKDTNGNYKRRISLEEATRDGQHDDDEDALVYIHHVQPQDTLAGVVLRYNCQPAVFRKANRLWPNDSIQIRKIVVLPVDACTIKGRPCEPPAPDSQGVDLLAPTPAAEDSPPFNDGSTWPGSSSSQNGSSAEHPETEEHPWTHVRWVLVDSSPSSKPVEIARMPRKTLGYFPPRRRKSQVTASSISTPRGSSEFPRISQTISRSSNDPAGSTASTPPRRTSNLGPGPSQIMSGSYGSYFPPVASSTRPRRESVGEAANRLGWMQGPGGVGTLSKNVRKPGPSQDGLNAWARKHIPGLAIDSLPSASLVGGESAHFGFSDELASIAEGGPMRGGLGSGTATPSGSGQGLGLESAAAAIEGWVRRLAIKAPGTPSLGGRTESTDLIELLDGTSSDDGRGFEPHPGAARTSTPNLGGTGREGLGALIRERSPGGSKAGKSD